MSLNDMLPEILLDTCKFLTIHDLTQLVLISWRFRTLLLPELIQRLSVRYSSMVVKGSGGLGDIIRQLDADPIAIPYVKSLDVRIYGPDREYWMQDDDLFQGRRAKRLGIVPQTEEDILCSIKHGHDCAMYLLLLHQLTDLKEVTLDAFSFNDLFGVYVPWDPWRYDRSYDNDPFDSDESGDDLFDIDTTWDRFYNEIDRVLYASGDSNTESTPAPQIDKVFSKLTKLHITEWDSSGWGTIALKSIMRLCNAPSLRELTIDSLSLETCLGAHGPRARQPARSSMCPS